MCQIFLFDYSDLTWSQLEQLSCGPEIMLMTDIVIVISCSYEVTLTISIACVL